MMMAILPLLPLLSQRRSLEVDHVKNQRRKGDGYWLASAWTRDKEGEHHPLLNIADA
jgi:hypothetical protein